MMNKWHVAAAAAALGLPACTEADAQLLAFSDWEAPNWSTGTIAGQNGWFFSGTTAGHKVVEAGKDGIPSAPAAGGSRIHVSTTSGNVGFLREVWGDLRDQWETRTSGNDVVHADLDFFMPASNSTDSHGITLYNTDNFILGKVYFSAFQSTVHVVSLAGTTDFRTEVTNGFAINQWNHLDVYADYSSKLFTTQVNGKTIAQSAFIDSGAFADVDLSNFSASKSSVFYTDNFRVRAEGVHTANTPGPDALLLFATGMGYPLMTAMRRRRSGSLRKA